MKYKTIKEKGRTIHIAICERCEQVLKHVGSFAQKYCEECKPIVYREKARERMRRYRERRKKLAKNNES